jgi:hypothetical protein
MKEIEPITYRPVNQHDPFNLSWDDVPENYYYQPDGGLIILQDTSLIFEGCIEIMFIDCDRFRSFEIFCVSPGMQYDAMGMLQHIYDYWDIGHDNVAVWKWEHGGTDFNKNVHLGFIRK